MRYFCLLLLVVASAAQKKPASPPDSPAPPAATTTLTTTPDYYPLPLAERDQFRDLQHEYDQIEIENQKMLLKIEQNKARQASLIDQETIIASQYARSKNIDLTTVELDPAAIVLRRKKVTKEPVK